MFEKLFGRAKGTSTSGDETSVPLDVIAAMVESAVGKAVRGPNRIAFNGFGGVTTIDVVPVHQKTPDRQEVEAVVRISTELGMQDFPFDERMFALINTMTSFGALFRDPKTGRVIIGSRISVYRGDDVWRLYAPLVAFSALLQAETLLKSLAQQIGGKQVEPMQLPGHDEPSQWSRKDFEATAQQLSSRNLLANGGDGGMTVEFPWEPGAVSAIGGQRTSLLQCRSDTPHPLLGNGLFYKLDLPVRFGETQLPKLASQLNLHEWSGVDAVPFFGAWCSNLESGLLTFAGFWPNLMYQPGTVSNIAVWMMHRSTMARGLLARPN